MAKWSIEKRVASCGECESEFADGESYYSLLTVAVEGLARRNTCTRCRTDELLEGALFWWRTRHREDKGKGLQLDLEAIEALFLALGGQASGAPESGDEEPGDEPAASSEAPSAATSERLLELRYLMCLILLRKRRLKVMKVAREHAGVEGEFFLVKRPRRDGLLAVQVFDFDGDKIELLRGDLQRIFEGADPTELETEIAVESQPGGTQVAPEVTAESPADGGCGEAMQPGERPSGASSDEAP